MINICTDEAPRIKIPNNVGISDAGATGTFVVTGAPVVNIRPTKKSTKNHTTAWRHNRVHTLMQPKYPMASRGHARGAYSTRTRMCKFDIH